MSIPRFVKICEFVLKMKLEERRLSLDYREPPIPREGIGISCDMKFLIDIPIGILC